MPNFKSVVHFFVVLSNYFFSSIFFRKFTDKFVLVGFFSQMFTNQLFFNFIFSQKLLINYSIFSKIYLSIFFSSKNLDILISVYAKQYICVFLLTHPPILGSKTHFRANIDLGGTLWGLFWQSPLKSASQGTF